ncbi:2-aminomuconic semialdehyde dehydrogenase-like [Homarus americanus]|uniref:2-aminomuconic semialdehyde dehydrogenase-like n=1 Tax=Homarus americanus TaxID=6706 RepID=A0A8J5JMB1_HOMAM|nr:2-aminomuconic semialdehyde dehydrogenase-like [Homarus americanus]
MDELMVLDNFIAGTMVPCKRLLDSYNPSTGKVWAKVPDSGKLEIEAAVSAAKRAYPNWSSMSAQRRANYLLKVADLLESRLEEFAVAESQDQGKPVWLARTMDMPRAVLNLRHFAHTIPHQLNTSSVQPEAGVFNYTIREPVGVAGLISPWNLPLYLLTFKLGPALMYFPAGVVNMVFGLGPSAGEALVTHPDVPLVSFTGSTVTGRHIAQATAPMFKKLSLEMGGKNAAVVFSDCDLESCINSLKRGSFINQGQVDESVFMGALNSKPHLEKVRCYVKYAIEDGGTIVCGETIDSCVLSEENKNGYFMRPTIITGLSDDSRCMQEEIFGPVTCVVPFDTEEEVITRANNTSFGLCASVWTSNLGLAHRMAHKLKVGTVWTNCWVIRDIDMPFGGVKGSGIGREGTVDSMEFYTEVKTICTKIS